MRFSLQDVRKSIQRRGGNLTVSFHFLRPDELQAEIIRLITYHEQLLGQPQRLFSQDDARACIGDYRLADCLIATLSDWYNWRARPWQEVVSGIEGHPTLLSLSPLHLRLALYDYVNANQQGFLTAQMRQQVLHTFAEQYQINVPELEYLLALDSEGETLLVRNTPQPPTPQEVATHYNRRVFEAALFNASRVRLTIDCAAFTRLQAGTLQGQPDQIESGIGTVIKRLCYLARRIGVYYDLAYETDTRPSLPALAPLLSLTLYGPQDVTGAPQQYGLRLVRLCRVLLLQTRRPGHVDRPSSRKKAALSGAIVNAEATVHFLQRSYTFSMTDNLLRLLPSPEPNEQSQALGTSTNDTFDSSIEQIFAEAFQALAGSRGVDGWRLEREPEPLLLERSIFIPDFALTRGTRRIYVEILGFWTPSYRERKIQKLQALRGRDDLLLAIPNEARDAFAAIADSFPIVYYEGQLGVMELLQVLQQRYDDFTARLAKLDLSAISATIYEQGFLAETDCYEQFHCYRRSEIQQVADRLCNLERETCPAQHPILFVPGLGFYYRPWLQQLHDTFLTWMQPRPSASLHDVAQALQQMQPVLQSCPETTISALLEQWPDIAIRRDSIFEATVELLDQSPTSAEQPSSSTDPQIATAPAKVTKKAHREKRTNHKKRLDDAAATVQGNLWGE